MSSTPASDPAGSGRARPLPPAERRAALIAATVPLVAEHGMKVTSRLIAEAAGVAEGTIFRVFRDKDELVAAAIAAVMDPAPMLAEIDRIDLAPPLEVRLREVVTILQRRLIRVFSLLTAVGMQAPPEKLIAHRRMAAPTNERIYEAVARVLEPDRDALRYPPREVARLLRLLTFSGSHPMITDGNPLTTDQIVAVLLDGVRHQTTRTGPGGRRC